MTFQVKRVAKSMRVVYQEKSHGTYIPCCSMDFSSWKYDEFGSELIEPFNAFWCLGFPVGNQMVDLALRENTGIFDAHEFMNSPLNYLAEKTKGLQWEVHLKKGCDFLLYAPLSSDMQVWKSSGFYHDFWFDAKKKVTLSEFLSVWENLQTASYISDQELKLADGRRIICKKSGKNKTLVTEHEYLNWKEQYSKQLEENGEFLLSQWVDLNDMRDLFNIPNDCNCNRADFKVLSWN